MEPFTTITGAAAPIPEPNIDTDVIMPKQFLKGITREGLAEGAFHDLRFAAPGVERPEFILNRPGWREARFLVVGPNFGCGSSREHAVWGLLQRGVRAIIGTSFASIFHDNCFRNGLLPVGLEPDQVTHLQALCADPERNRLTIDLAAQTITAPEGGVIRFAIDPLRRDDLLQGRDSIAATLGWSDDLRAFEGRHFAARPWFEPGR